MLKNDRYTYRITWSEEDQEYVGLCVEFPSLSWLDKKKRGRPGRYPQDGGRGGSGYESQQRDTARTDRQQAL